MLQILDKTVATLDGLYSLNDLHRASGGNPNHQPSNFMRNENTIELIKELERSSDLMNGSNNKAYRVIKGGEPNKQGTYVCRELVYSYAMWISPKFQLLVIRAFDLMANQQINLMDRANQLCRALNQLDNGLSHAGRFLSVGGKQVKPQLIHEIDKTINELQPSLDFNSKGINYEQV